MRPDLEAGLYMLTAQECIICHKYALDGRQLESRLIWHQIKTRKYELCPACRRVVGPGLNHRLSYRRRWDKFMREVALKLKARPATKVTAALCECLAAEVARDEAKDTDH